MRQFLHLFLLTSLFFITSCANYKLNYHKDAKGWESIQLPNEVPKHTMYLIGDAGNSPLGETSPALKLLKAKLAQEGANSSVIFLGDNNYPGGLPRKVEKEERTLAEHHLDVQLDALKNYDGRPIFIPGNHDWRHYGKKGLRRMEKYIEKRLNAGVEDEDDWENYFIPDDGCGGPEVVEINDQLVVVIVDTQWWISDWDKEPEMNDGCEAKSRGVLSYNFEEALRKHRNKNVVVAMHHPFYTYGPHGGRYTIKQHIFPLTDLNDDLYIPLPGIGTIGSFLRASIGHPQDATHSAYKNMRKKLLAGATKNGRYIFVSGHEHNLQYIQQSDQHFIVSGAGSKKSPVALGEGSEFGYGGSGFAQMDFYADGSGWLTYWTPEGDGSTGKMIFRKKIKDKLSISKENIPESFPEYDLKKDSVEITILDYPVKEKKGLYNGIMGRHYRDTYIPTYKFPVLDLATFQGGLTPIKRGGGNQTNSLRLQDSDGKQWVMRSMTKDASRFIPYPFNKISATQPLVEDSFLSTNPFAAIAIPNFAKALGIYHTNPRLYYIPKQPALDLHNDLFGGGLYLVEERPDDDMSDSPSFGNSKKVMSTPDVIEKIQKNASHQADQPFILRTHMLDLTIGDWDRHDDQWRWARFKGDDGLKVYRPIPRDRDQPFSKYDGLVLAFGRMTVPFLKQLQTYRPEVKNVKWSAYGGRAFNQTFLTKLTWQDWEEAVKETQAKLTDDLIDETFKSWPGTAYQTSGAEIAEKMKKRRDNLMVIARKHYELLAKAVDVLGTEERERFVVERLNDQETRVRVYELSKKGKQKDLFFERTFLTGETKEIRLIGLDGKDELLISGTVKKGILVRAIGGLGDDYIKDESKVSGGSKKTKVYDSLEDNKLELGSEAKDLTSASPEYNIYNRRDYHYEYGFTVPTPALGYNPDDGVFFGNKWLFTHYKFKKDPYHSTHKVGFNFYTASLGLEAFYEGDFIQSVGKWDFLLKANIKTPTYAENFFGLGNESTQNIDSTGIEYHRVRQARYRVEPALKYRFAGNAGRITIGPSFERVEVEDTQGRFVVSEDSELPLNIFDAKDYAGAHFGLNYENVDNTTSPHRGMKFNLGFAWRTNLSESDKSLSTLSTSLAVYQNLDPNNRFILATKVGFQRNFGTFEFFQAATLGGTTNLRGFRRERFYGRTSFFHNTDLRIKLFTSNNQVLPFSLGILGGFDYGRVWQDEEDSDLWHSAYGGGLWISPIDFIIISGEYFISDDDQLLAIRMKYFF